MCNSGQNVYTYYRFESSNVYSMKIVILSFTAYYKSRGKQTKKSGTIFYLFTYLSEKDADIVGVTSR